VETLMATETRRVVIIGGGHNGLVAAFHLAKAGFAPLLLEKRGVVGGVAVVEEIHPGFRCPTLLHSAGPLLGLPAVMRHLASPSHSIALHPEGRALRIYEDPQRTAAELTAFSAHDAKGYPEFHSCLIRLGAALRPIISITPPNTDSLMFGDYLNLGRFGLKFRGLDRKDAFRLLRWGPMPVADLAAEWFENELLRAAVAARGIFGSFAGPRSAGSSVGLLMQAALGDGVAGVNELAQALAREAAAVGVQIRTNASVSHIQVKDGHAHSVVLDGGEEIRADTIVSNLDPRRTFLQLVDAKDLDPGFLMKVRAYRATGAVAKVNLALSGCPVFTGVRDSQSDLSGRIHIGPDIDYLERAFDAAKYGEFSPHPYMEIRLPSITDPSVAPNGCHVMSVHVQYAPYRLKNGDWQGRRQELGNAVLTTLSEYAPNLRQLIVNQQIITPSDMEEIYGLSGGHIFHGEHSLDQLFAFRPFLGWARYRTPIDGLYLCGAGTHPGGGITGLPGANASREIIKALKSRR
jgi:phytoene dehydrogenase-like protein